MWICKIEPADVLNSMLFHNNDLLYFEAYTADEIHAIREVKRYKGKPTMAPIPVKQKTKKIPPRIKKRTPSHFFPTYIRPNPGATFRTHANIKLFFSCPSI